ncbi:hypothetical protein BGZ95_002280 [Linnemannia exigua]|uniref:Uncharacterized protein n=1 Tax=Linnemannia exigua TaxID=604196 RepID=A0AAD4DK65_9FUNG|nr:hypothetical protein BGZ95_002280 [Linnemannia exigua]
MAFAHDSGFLKADFVMSTILAILGFVIYGTMSRNAYWDFGDQKLCLLLANPKTFSFHNSACAFTNTIGFLIAAGGIALFAMDFVTWKRSERFKGKRASVAALLIAPTLCFFSFATAIVIGTGVKTFCNNFEVAGSVDYEGCKTRIVNLNGIQAGVGASTVAGFLFAFYGYSEYIQYRKRHINGDKIYDLILVVLELPSSA